MKHLWLDTKSWLDNLKLRVGYGVAGTTAGIAEYSSMASLENVTNVLGRNDCSVSQVYGVYH